ncbi:MAG: tetratricopeptide repeat protein [Saprospiraceae bacterium]|nr:tetratricopeptide repeat protein [Saprospiraceae bacterium]
MGEFYDFADRPFIAIDYYHKYIQAYQQFNLLDEKTIRLAHNYLGLCYFIVGNLRLASDCFTQEMEWTKKIFGPESDQLASNLNNMSVIKRHLNDTLASRKFIERALELRIKIGIKDKNKLGNLYQKSEQSSVAFWTKSQAMNSIKKSNQPKK